MAEDTPTASAPAGEERATDAETKPVVAAEAAPETSQEKEAEKEKPSGKLFPDGAIFFFVFFPRTWTGRVVYHYPVSCIALECIANGYMCLH